MPLTSNKIYMLCHRCKCKEIKLILPLTVFKCKLSVTSLCKTCYFLKNLVTLNQFDWVYFSKLLNFKVNRRYG